MHPGTLLTNLDLVLKFSTHVVKVSARLDRATVIDYLFESLSLTRGLVILVVLAITASSRSGQNVIWVSQNSASVHRGCTRVRHSCPTELK
jgi:hypothetical protein